MSEHAQALMLSTKVCVSVFECIIIIICPPQVHAMFGHTLMLAGVARIVEVSFIAPKYAPLEVSDGDSHSDHTLTDTGREEMATGFGVAGRAFRHLPSFVSGSLILSAQLHHNYFGIRSYS